jgi:hypothetical protein
MAASFNVLNSSSFTVTLPHAFEGEMGNAYKILVGTPEGNRSFGRTRRRREGNVKFSLCLINKYYVMKANGEWTYRSTVS